MKQIKNYINGELLKANSGDILPTINPATGEQYAELPDSDKTDVQHAIDAAKDAYKQWKLTDLRTRSRILIRIADLIEQNLDKLAEAESIDNGKPISLAKGVDIPRASDNFRFFATAVLHSNTEAHIKRADQLNFTMRQSLGVVGCISPWNLPLYLFTWKIAPALAAGNCVVAKPSEVTPMTAFLLSELCIKAGLPAGVLNIVHGTGPKAGNAIITHPEIKAISFTGGTNTGKHIASIAGPLLKKMSLELGGKNPNIIFADCDFEQMMKTTLHSSFANQGQICLCGSRIFIERPIYQKFKHEFVKRAQYLIPADPQEEKTKMGALVSKDHMQKVLSYIELAQAEGGSIICGGKQVQLEGRCKHGFFVEPTIIENLAFNCQTNMEEIFGPVVTIMPFDTEEEVIHYANCTDYGLSATVWTSDIGKANRCAENLEAGIVWINCWLERDLRTPFGGVKQSGIGREGGWEALRFFTEAKNVCIKY